MNYGRPCLHMVYVDGVACLHIVYVDAAACLHIVYVDAVACLHIVQVILYLVKLSVLSKLRQCARDLATIVIFTAALGFNDCFR